MARGMLLLFALTSACSFQIAPLHYFDPKGDVYVASEFTSEQAEVVLSAIAAWHDATQGAVSLKPQIGNGSPGIRPARERDGVVGEFVPSAEPEIIVDLEKAPNARSLRPTVLHELGHAFRLKHIGRVDSVMFRYATWVQDVDPWTLEAWQELNAAEPAERADAARPPE
jgi:hypothetical protein